MRALFAAALFFASGLNAQDLPARAGAILHSQCSACHSAAMSMSGLDLTSREAALKGGTRGTSIVPGKSAESRLVEAVLRKGKLAMPPAKALPETDVATLREWIDAGAAWPGAQQAGSQQASKWWSFQKPVKAPLPAGNAPNPIDRFVLAKLREKGLRPAAEASRTVLIRRAYFDLTGLPPSPTEVAAFEKDEAPDAWEKLVDRLLASPQYGEKWGRFWLDLVRYSDTAGFELDTYLPDAWRYRDWVIQSFNEDKPYQRFIREQLAGDEYAPEDPVAMTGTGYFCVGPNRDLFPDQADINREEILTDYADTTSAVFQGLTAGCARCHDHKFDPISQKDYYRIQAAFAPFTKVKIPLNRLGSLGWDVGESNREIRLREIGEQIRAVQRRCRTLQNEAKLNALPAEAQEAIRTEDGTRTPRQRELATEFEGKARVSDDEVRGCLTAEETAKLHGIEKSLVSMFANYGPKPFACGIADLGYISPKTYMPARGSRPKEEVQPGFFSVLGGGEVPPPAEKREGTGPIPLNPTTGRRKALAEWISADTNPLTSRVMVNRIWQEHFGRGIVATPSDFGTRGRAPTHPELLDWLAVEFVERGWSIKQMHRLLMTSATYRQASTGVDASAENDPENLWLSRFSRRRLTADEIRDTVLASAGTLNRKASGRPVVIPLGKEELATLTQSPATAWIVTGDTAEHTRRSIYLLQKRTFRLPMMEVFDAPEPMVTCARRESSTTAPQSLTLFNGSFVLDQARAMAAQFEASDNAAFVHSGWRQILLREPSVAERDAALAFLTKQQAAAGTRLAARTELIRGLLNINEFLYVD